MTKHRRIPASGSRSTSAKSSTRLRVERLESRSLLSAIGLSLTPISAPPLQPAALGEYYQAGGERLVQAALSQATPVLDATLTLAPLQRSPGAGDGLRDRLVAAVRLGDQVQSGDFQLAADPANAPSFSPDPAIDVSIGLGDSGSGISVGWLPSRGTDTVRIESASPAIQPLPVVLSGELAPDAPPPVDPAVLMHGMTDFQANIDGTWMGARGPAGFREPPSRDSEQAMGSNVEIDVSLNVEAPAPQVVKIHSPDGPGTTNDASRAGDQTSAAFEAYGSAPSDPAIPLSTILAFSDPAIANSMQGGFIALDDSSATLPQPGGAPPLNTGLQAVEGAGPDLGSWLSDILPNPGKPADFSSSRSSQAVLSGRNSASDVASRAAVANWQPVAAAEEGGGIELTIAAPSLA